MAAKTETAGAALETEEKAPLVLSELVEPLKSLEEPRPFAAQALLDFSDLMKRVQVGLLTRSPKTEELADQDRWARGKGRAAAAAQAGVPPRRKRMHGRMGDCGGPGGAQQTPPRPRRWRAAPRTRLRCAACTAGRPPPLPPPPRAPL
jgi:hypothetical protein